MILENKILVAGTLNLGNYVFVKCVDKLYAILHLAQPPPPPPPSPPREYIAIFSNWVSEDVRIFFGLGIKMFNSLGPMTQMEAAML